MNVIIRESAYGDLDQIYSWIAQDRPLVARRVVDRILNSIELLGLLPDLGHAGKLPGTNEWVAGGLPYIIIYTVDRVANEVAIIAVFHSAQNR
jgi:toxin ParE1/3/4